MKWSVHDLMPTCLVPTCSRYGTRHMLDHQAEIATQILAGNENYIYLQGGVGSAKTALFGALAAAFAIMIPGSTGILFRKDFGLNHETLWGYFQASIRAALEQGIISGLEKNIWSVKVAGGHTICKLPNGSVFRAGETKNWSRAMGPTYCFIAISDAMENNNFGEIFHGEGTVGGLQSRLRGQRSSFYKLPNGNFTDMRRFLIESNPPPRINELHRIFGKEPGVRNITEVCDPVTGKYITYRHIQISSVQNDHNPPSYVAEIAAMHSNPGDIKRILEGKTVPYYGGVRVIESFQHEVHVSSFTIETQHESLPLFVGIDPDYQHPAVTFSQIRRCSYDKEHYITLSEITNLFDTSAKELIENDNQDLLGILAHLALFYPTYFDYENYTQVRNHLLAINETHIDYEILERHFSNIIFCIGREGNKHQSLNDDKITTRQYFLQKYGIRCKYRNDIGLDKSLDRLRSSFKHLCLCNVPQKLIDQKCELLIDAYGGGYRYEKKKDGSHTDKPLGDHLYEDPCDADRYSMENFFFTQYIPSSIEKKKLVTIAESPYSWMDSNCMECGEAFNTKAELMYHKERIHSNNFS